MFFLLLCYLLLLYVHAYKLEIFVYMCSLLRFELLITGMYLYTTDLVCCIISSIKVV
jgi:hypothetical protein